MVIPFGRQLYHLAYPAAFSPCDLRHNIAATLFLLGHQNWESCGRIVQFKDIKRQYNNCHEELQGREFMVLLLQHIQHGKQNIPIKPMDALTKTSSKSSNHFDSAL